jgi:5-methylthioadenosine/S-adenosylhomocysteine deaminase
VKLWARIIGARIAVRPARLPSEMSSADHPRPVDLLIQGGTVVCVDEAFTVIEDGAVAVDGTDIVAVGLAADLKGRFAPLRVIGARGHAVLPGLVNGHTHVAMTLFRGMADDLALETWLTDHIWPAEAAYVDRDSVARGTTLACVEMLRGGTTTALDMYWFPRECAAAARRTGLRLVVGGVLLDGPGADGLSHEERLAENRALLAEFRSDPLIGVSIQPHSTYTVSPEHLVEAHALAVEFGVRFALHAAETVEENRIVLERHGRTPVRHLHSLELLGPRTTLHHAVHLDDEEIGLLQATGTSAVHCLESELKLASGIPRLPALLRAGVNVGLGTDGAASNNDLDLWSEMRLAALLYKALEKDPTAIPARQALRLATLGGARALGIDHMVGSIEPGKRADIVLVDLDRPHLSPVYNVVSHLVYAANRNDVTTVLVNGVVVVEDGHTTLVEEREAMAGVREVADRIRRRELPSSLSAR